MSRRMLVVGNWKMNGLRAQLGGGEAIGAFAADHPTVEVGLCLPATLIGAAADQAGGAFIGAQGCHAKTSGAHTQWSCGLELLGGQQSQLQTELMSKFFRER